jgi:Flp pilus assembly protein TadD
VTLNQQDWNETLDVLCRSAARHILAGISFSEFRERMEGMLPVLLEAGGIPKETQAPEMLRSMATLMALEIWNATPIPENRFRPRKQAKPERNAPCPCGSGRKFKQCCGAVDAPELGISEELMLVQVLGLMPAKTLAELPLLELPPESLAIVARQWVDEGQPKKAVALLEKLFVHLDQLDGRAELAADTLLNAYMEVNTPRQKQKFIEALKAAPDKALASTGWQRQTTVHSDRGNYAAAWAAFREAQRLTPNEPALSHLEVLVLVSEGRREEARARARFWAARLARDPQFDHSALIKLLHDLADGSDESLLRTLPLGRGPLADLAEAIARWPEPACHYRLSGGAELTAKKDLYELEREWSDLAEEGNLDSAIRFLGEQALAGQSFRILRDVVEIAGSLPENLPGSGDALARRLLERAEALRRLVLGRLKALTKELSWGFLDNRPMLTLVSYYIDEFAAARPTETLDLLRWSVRVANPNDNLGLREILIHTLVAAGLAEEAMAVAARYPDDIASTEFGRVLALFAAGRLAEAETALRAAAVESPRVWKMLHAANPRMPRINPRGITVGGNDEAYEYRRHYLDLWRASGALKWGAGIRITAPNTAKKPAKKPDNDPNGALF